MVKAVKHENALELLDLLRDYCPEDFAVAVLPMEEATSRGKVHVLEWLVANFEDVFWCSGYASAAAAAGHLNVLQWLKTHFQEDAQDWRGAVVSASVHDHLEVVQWLHQNVPTDSWTGQEFRLMLDQDLEPADLKRA